MTVLILGATGTAGRAVLDASLASSAVGGVNAIVRRAMTITHPRLQTYRHENFLDFTGSGDVFAGIDACCFCLAPPMRECLDEAAYRRVTLDMALTAARALRRKSPHAHFHYLSAAGASLTSRWMWARVKAEAERVLIDEADATCWRAGFIDAPPGVRAPAWYSLLRPALRILRPWPRLYITGDELGRAILAATGQQWRRRIIENDEARRLAGRLSDPS